MAVSRNGPYRAQREGGRRGWTSRKNAVGTGMAVGGSVCNKNSSSGCCWDLLRSEVRLRRLTDGGKNTGRNCTAKGKGMERRERAVVRLSGRDGEEREREREGRSNPREERGTEMSICPEVALHT